MSEPSLAVSLEDLDRISSDIRGPLFTDRLDLENIIGHAGQHRKERVPAVQFTCSLLTAAIIVDLLRKWDRKAGCKEPTRAFIKRDTVWERVPVNQRLTVVIGDKPQLNPEVFGEQRGVPERIIQSPASAVPLLRKR